MNRRSGFGLSMLLMTLWLGQTALTTARFVLSLSIGTMAVVLGCVSGSILSGVYQPDAIPDEEMGSLQSFFVVTMFSIGILSLLLTFFVYA